MGRVFRESTGGGCLGRPLLWCATLLLLSLPVAACDSGAEEPAPPARPRSPMEGWQDTANAAKFHPEDASEDPAAIARGRALVDVYRSGQRCMSCHDMPEGTNPQTGPALWGVGGRYSRALGGELQARRWLHNKIWEPDKFPGLNSRRFPPGQMPRGAAYFTPEEVADIVSFLMTIPEKPSD